jgi:hypothetical protein
LHLNQHSFSAEVGGQHPLPSSYWLPHRILSFGLDQWIFRGDLIGDGGGGKTQYNVRSDALAHTKDAEDQGAPQED